MKHLFVLLFALLALSVSAQTIDVVEYHVVVPDEGVPHLEIGAMFVKYNTNSVEYADRTTDFEYGLITDQVHVFMANEVEDGLSLTTFTGSIATVNRYIDVNTNKVDYLHIRSKSGQVWSTNNYQLAKTMLQNQKDKDKVNPIATVRF